MPVRFNAPRVLAVTTILFVGAMVVATSVPAQAFISPASVQAQLLAVGRTGSMDAAAQTLRVTHSAGDPAVRRDAVTATSEVQLAELHAQQIAQQQAAASAAAAQASVAAAEASAGAAVPTGTVIWPFAGVITISSPFGPRVAPTPGASTFHEGIDIEEPLGTPIHAIASGTVVAADPAGTTSCGVTISLLHVINGQTVVSKYCHMELGSLTLTVGAKVTVGEVIGLVGQTGIATGPHLHLEIHPGGGAAVDPDAWLTANVHAGTVVHVLATSPSDGD